MSDIYFNGEDSDMRGVSPFIDGEALLRWWVDEVCREAIMDAKAYGEVQELRRMAEL